MTRSKSAEFAEWEWAEFPLEVKLADDPLKGEINGYASVFDGIDSYGDSIAPGAFARTLAERKARGSMPPMYFQHGALLGGDPRPVGVWTSIEEDATGLKVLGKLASLDTDQGRYNLGLIRDGAMRGLSIGYRMIKADYPRENGGPIRVLREVKLREISVVDDPADGRARFSLKSATFGGMTARDWRELEGFLRDEGDLSRSDAVKSVSALKAWMIQREAGQPGPSPRDEGEAALMAQVRRNIATLIGS